METAVKRKPGRPPGKKKPALDRPEEYVDYDYPDPETLVARMFSMINWTQIAIRNEMRRSMENPHMKDAPVKAGEVERLEKLSNTLVRAIDALKKANGLAEELAKQLSPEQLLEAAMKKLETQDLATLTYAIRRLRAHRDRVAPTGAARAADDVSTATDAIAALA